MSTVRPLIQIDDLVRPMTDEELAQCLADQENAPPPLGSPEPLEPAN